MNTYLPTRAELKDKLSMLCRGELSREKASNWAISIINNELINVDDIEAWEILKLIGAADLPSTDRDYLYDNVDFKEWRLKLIQD